MSVYTKFHPNQTMGKWSNIRGKFSEGEFHRGGGKFGGRILVQNKNIQNKVAK